MAPPKGPPTAGAVTSPTLDLKWSLTLRVVAVALLCFVIAAAIALFGTYRDVRQANENVADIVVKQLQVQLFRIDSNIDLPARFPDWDPVTERVQTAGQCIHYVKAGRQRRAIELCRLRSPAAMSRRPGFPPWARGSSAARADIARPISYHGTIDGTLVVTTEPAVVLAAIWKDVSGLLGLTALVVGAICLLQYVAISRALRPTKDILAGLDRLARGDLSCRLPSFRLDRASAHQRGLQHARGKSRPDDARADRTGRPARRRSGAGAPPSGAGASRRAGADLERHQRGRRLDQGDGRGPNAPRSCPRRTSSSQSVDGHDAIAAHHACRRCVRRRSTISGWRPAWRRSPGIRSGAPAGD